MKRVAMDSCQEGAGVHLWWTVPPDRIDSEAARKYEALLDPGERHRRRRFLSAIDRRMFLVSRAFLRTRLAECARVPPAELRFRLTGRGRPELVPGTCGADLRFNLSHTRGLIALAVTIGLDIGVDVEDRSRTRRWEAIAGRFFPPEERDWLRGLPARERHDRFLESWILKEAYLKARGLGVPGPLSRISFLPQPGRAIGPRFDPGLGDDPAAWQFALFRPTAAHLMALAVRRGRGPDLPIRVRRTGI